MSSPAPGPPVEVRDAAWAPVLGYAVALDRKRFEDLALVFHPDLRADYAGATFDAAAPVIERMTRLHHHLAGSLHRLSNHRVLEVTADGIVAETYVDALLVGGDAVGGRTYRDVGRYVDLVVEHEGRWCLAERRYHRLWRDGDVADLQPPGSETP